jgi:MarR family
MPCGSRSRRGRGRRVRPPRHCRSDLRRIGTLGRRRYLGPDAEGLAADLASRSRNGLGPSSAPSLKRAGRLPRYGLFVPGWTFVTSHARVLIALASTPGITLREVAAEAGITERAAHRVVAELEEAGYLTRHRLGHRNFYELHPEVPLRDPMLDDRKVGDLIATFVGRGQPPAERLAELALPR